VSVEGVEQCVLCCVQDKVGAMVSGRKVGAGSGCRWREGD
jgi:hypothetical protein